MNSIAPGLDIRKIPLIRIFSSHLRPLAHKLHGKLARRQGYIESKFGAKFVADHPAMGDHLLWLVRRGTYEAPELNALMRFVPEESEIVELGGCIGFIAVHAMKVKRCRRVVSVELDRSACDLIRRNAKLNGVAIEVKHGAIAPGPDDSVLYIPAESGLSRRTARREDAGQAASSTAKGLQLARAPRLEFRDLCVALSTRSAVLVCDIEGAEVELVRSHAELIREYFQQIIMELHPRIRPDEYQSAVDSLLGCGYELLWRQSDTVVLARN